MLEHSCLWLEPLRPGKNGPCRIICDALTKEVLGRAKYGHPAGIIGWFFPRVWTVTEAPDDSLLFAVRHRWKWSNERMVYDAENALVATLSRHQVFGPDGWPVATQERGRFQSPSGMELAGWRSDLAGTYLEFRPAVENEPLVKMMLLAAVLET